MEKLVDMGPIHNPDHEYDDNCPGCQPGILDIKTNRPLPLDHPMMVKIMQVWKNIPLDEKRAWHRVIMQGSKNAIDRRIAEKIGNAFRKALEEIP